MSRREYTRRQDICYGLAFILWLAAPFMVVAGIWLDWRWFATALVVVVIGFVFAWAAEVAP